MSNESRTRLAVLVSHPIQHFAPWHAETARLPDVELKVFFYARWGLGGLRDPEFGTDLKWDVPLLEGYEHEFLEANLDAAVINDPRLDNPSVGERLRHFNPDVVQVFGYTARTTRRAAAWCAQAAKPLLLYSDSNLQAQPWWKGMLKQVTVGRFYRKVDGALYVGNNNYDYHRYFGLPPDRLFHGCLPVDRTRLESAAGDRAATRRMIRERHRIPPDAFVALFCGKLVPRKRPLDLIRAVASAGVPIWALIVGEGELRPAIENAIQAEQVNAVLAGFVNQSAISSYYAAADVLAVTSSFDPHPLIVTEAAVFGLPVVVNERVGCIGKDDTARPGGNAIVFPNGDTVSLAEALRRLQADRGLYERMSQMSRTIGLTQDTVVAAGQLRDAAQKLKALGKR